MNRREEWLDIAAEAAKTDDAVMILVITVEPSRRKAAQEGA